MTTNTDTTTDPLLGFSPDEIIVGPGGQTLAQAATTETDGWPEIPACITVVSNHPCLPGEYGWECADCGATSEHYHAPQRDAWRSAATHRCPAQAAAEAAQDAADEDATGDRDLERYRAADAERIAAGLQPLHSEYAPQRRIGDSGEVRCGDLMGPHDGVRLCGACATTSPDERTIPCGALLEATPAEPASVRIRLLGYDLEHDAFDPSKDVLSTGADDVATVDDVLDWVSITADVDRRNLEVRGREIWVRGACAALAVIEATPPSLAEELAAMPEADRRVAERVADLDLIEPAPGYVERAVERARREGVL